ncbi:N-6 DNA methylase [Blastopirellula sp. JC732]|uniref:site-specific DNA-methyltransferase (adenine-specific) n=1 Tax=Blastopirellula sediminis TaxID=2894196 RepID=A0A9X1SHU2_9BACT|nr:N-6 DNA methylase [Blastopirellula sediminis]MCC9606225.1 N-6 DNA methylase [Blastopirellula sediminis]MCC9630477.1 N-6 DNA methylase [Blastopirellula sediminis]
MLSPQLRSKVHSLWTMFWAAGMTNPLVAIEQITYLLFLRQLEHFDQKRVEDGKPTIYGLREVKDSQGHVLKNDDDTPVTIDYDVCRWEYIRQNPTFELFNDTVFPWLRQLEKWLKENNPSNHDPLEKITGRLDDAYFVLDPNKTDTLTRAVQAIHELFNQIGGANADIMGDIFEYLLGEIQTAGKNGQFRTPRHIIRFMIEVLDPPPITNGRPTRILDPACGTGGFLVNTLIHWKKNKTDKELLRLEWDGTPHRLFATLPEELDPNECFFGYDNDRTMVRIAWMNMILHDLDFPKIDQLDSLSKRMPDDLSDTFDFVLANPPYTGTVDQGDLSTNRNRVEFKGKKPLTTKSELLYVWMMLDLLRVGGRCAVVVPDGVLFGSTNAHKELRRKLLFEHTLEGVVSLPGGVFNPYSGVKTSILIFQKVGDEALAGREPRTKEVWFYEIAEEAFTLDQKRNKRQGQNNDLYDASEKFQKWFEVLQGSDIAGLREAAEATTYHQPEYWRERWRVIDDDFLLIFPEEESQKGHALGLHEIFADLPRDPEEMTEVVCTEGRALIDALTSQFVKHAWATGAKAKAKAKKRENAAKELNKRLRKLTSDLNKQIREKKVLDREYDEFGYKALKQTLDAASEDARANLETASKDKSKPEEPQDYDVAEESLNGILKCFARLDGYDIWLRSVDVTTHDEKPQKSTEHEEAPSDVLAWITPVRAWAKLDTWGADPETEKEIKKPTHDDDGLVDPEYLKFLIEKLEAFNDDGTVKDDFVELLDPDCIEAADLNLSAGRHKPFVYDPEDFRPPSELIEELDNVHKRIGDKLSDLLKMVGGGA